MGSDIPDYMRYWGKAKELIYPERVMITTY